MVGGTGPAKLSEKHELSQLLTAAGFDRFIVFCYEYPRDNNRLPTTLGFMAVAPGGECGKTLYPAVFTVAQGIYEHSRAWKRAVADLFPIFSPPLNCGPDP